MHAQSRFLPFCTQHSLSSQMVFFFSDEHRQRAKLHLNTHIHALCEILKNNKNPWQKLKQSQLLLIHKKPFKFTAPQIFQVTYKQALICRSIALLQQIFLRSFIKQKYSKVIEMIFYQLQDRVNQDQLKHIGTQEHAIQNAISLFFHLA